MRCNNCGWQNAANKARCEKCNYPLKGSLNAGQIEEQGPESNDADSNDFTNKLSKTITGGKSFMPSWDTPNTGELDDARNMQGSADSSFTRREEDHSNRPGDSGFDATRRESSPSGFDVPPTAPSDSGFRNSEEEAPAPERRNVRPPVSGREKYNRTFDPSRQPGMGRLFKLVPVEKEGENGLQEISFNDDSVELNRGNLDPDNYSITSKSQALIEYKDGSWYIEDKSDLKTTFIQASNAFPLKDGDIILLGNRKFIFKES